LIDVSVDAGEIGGVASVVRSGGVLPVVLGYQWFERSELGRRL